MASDNGLVRVGSTRPHCDACGFTGEPVEFDQIRTCIGMTCPKCDAVMITAEDCDTAEQMVRAMKALNGLVSALGIEVTDQPLGTLTLRTKDGGEVVGWTPNPEAAQ